MASHLISSLLIAASASTVSASKDYLRHAPLLAGSIIKYCEKDKPKSCETIDRRKEKVSADPTTLAGEVPLKIAELYTDFSSLSVDFSNSNLPDGFKINFDSKSGK